MTRILAISACLTLGGCPSPEPESIPARPTVTERVREWCFWVDDERLASILESVERDRMAGLSRDEVRASIARWCKDDMCNDCADVVLDQVYGSIE